MTDSNFSPTDDGRSEDPGWHVNGEYTISMNIMRYRFAPRSPRVLLDLYLNQESLSVCSDIQALSLITPPSSILVAYMELILCQ